MRVGNAWRWPWMLPMYTTSDTQAMRTSRSILIADDHGLIRSGLRQLLQALPGHTTLYEAESHEQVCRFFCKRIHLLLLDLAMPGVETVEQVNEICRQMPGTAVANLSATRSQAAVEECLQAGARGFIVKTNTAERILSAVQLILAGERYVPYAHDEPCAEEAIYRRVTPRQQTVWRLLSQGLSNKAIASELSLTEGTVKQHISSLFKIIGVRNRVEAVHKYRDVWRSTR